MIVLLVAGGRWFAVLEEDKFATRVVAQVFQFCGVSYCTGMCLETRQFSCYKYMDTL